MLLNACALVQHTASTGTKLPPPLRPPPQLSAALRAVHAAGMAVRPPCLTPSKVLVLPLGRLRLGSLGLVEALAGDMVLGGEELLQAQRDDVMVRWPVPGVAASECEGGGHE